MDKTVSKGFSLSKAAGAAVISAAIVGGLVWVGWKAFRSPTGALSPSPSPAFSSKTTFFETTPGTVFLPLADLSGLGRYDMDLADVREDPLEWVAVILGALTTSPSRQAVPVFSPGTRPRQIFWGDETLFLDLPNSVTGSIIAGVEFEGLALEALIRSLGANIPGLRAVKILVEGTDRETLWGHIDLQKPFPVSSTPSSE